MSDRQFFSISNFAKFSRTTRNTLIYYDKIGLLKPVARGENEYRLYSPDQLAMINMIRTCQALGMHLSEIKKVSEHRTPEQVYKMFSNQIERIDEKLSEWKHARKLLSHFKNIIQDVLEINTDKITVRHFPAQKIQMGNLNDYSKGRNEYDALLTFYHDMNEKFPDMDLNYPVWGYFSAKRLKNKDWVWPEYYYFNNPDGSDERPAGSYAVGYKRGNYGNSNDLYEKLMEYIDANGYEICGPGYEEYPLNEIAVSDSNNYLMRIMISVKKSAD